MDEGGSDRVRKCFFLSVPWFTPRDFGTDSLLVITSTAPQIAVEL